MEYGLLMEKIRKLSDEELKTMLVENHLPSFYNRHQRKGCEKKLFLRSQPKSAAPAVVDKSNSNDYFLLDLELPQFTKSRKLSLSNNLTARKKKNVTFKPTEIFGRDPILPNCVAEFNPEANNLHDLNCPNSKHETIDILGQQMWMNKKFLMKCRYG